MRSRQGVTFQNRFIAIFFVISLVSSTFLPPALVHGQEIETDGLPHCSSLESSFFYDSSPQVSDVPLDLYIYLDRSNSTDEKLSIEDRFKVIQFLVDLLYMDSFVRQVDNKIQIVQFTSEPLEPLKLVGTSSFLTLMPDGIDAQKDISPIYTEVSKKLSEYSDLTTLKSENYAFKDPTKSNFVDLYTDQISEDIKKSQAKNRQPVLVLLSDLELLDQDETQRPEYLSQSWEDDHVEGVQIFILSFGSANDKKKWSDLFIDQISDDEHNNLGRIIQITPLKEDGSPEINLARTLLEKASNESYDLNELGSNESLSIPQFVGNTNVAILREKSEDWSRAQWASTVTHVDSDSDGIVNLTHDFGKRHFDVFSSNSSSSQVWTIDHKRNDVPGLVAIVNHGAIEDVHAPHMMTKHGQYEVSLIIDRNTPIESKMFSLRVGTSFDKSRPIEPEIVDSHVKYKFGREAFSDIDIHHDEEIFFYFGEKGHLACKIMYFGSPKIEITHDTFSSGSLQNEGPMVIWRLSGSDEFDLQTKGKFFTLEARFYSSNGKEISESKINHENEMEIWDSDIPEGTQWIDLEGKYVFPSGEIVLEQYTLLGSLHMNRVVEMEGEIMGLNEIIDSYQNEIESLEETIHDQKNEIFRLESLVSFLESLKDAGANFLVPPLAVLLLSSSLIMFVAISYFTRISIKPTYQRR